MSTRTIRGTATIYVTCYYSVISVKLERTTIVDSGATTDTNSPENDKDVTRYAHHQLTLEPPDIGTLSSRDKYFCGDQNRKREFQENRAEVDRNDFIGGNLSIADDELDIQIYDLLVELFSESENDELPTK